LNLAFHFKQTRKYYFFASTYSFSAQKFSHDYEHTRESSVPEYDAM